MSIDMIVCPGCHWPHRSALSAAECEEGHEIEAAENLERFGQYTY